MKGKIYWDNNGKRWKISIHVDGTRHWIWRDPVSDEPLFEKWHAEKILNAIRHAVDVEKKHFNINQWKPQRPLAFDTYAKGWLEDKAKSVSRKTHQGYSTALKKYAIPFFKRIDIRKIKAKALRQFKESLPLADKGVYNTVGAVKTMFKDAWRDEDIERVPPFPKLSQNQHDIVEYLTLEQQEIVIGEIPEVHRPIFEFGMEYGLRVQEVRALKKDCIVDGEVVIRRRFAENELVETTKTADKGIRTFELTSYAKEVLKRNKKHLGPFVFVRNDGKPYTNKNLNVIWREACKKPKFTLKLQNAMRHSLGCQLLDQGHTLETVRQIYGHTNIKMTMRYTRRRVTKAANSALENRRAKVQLINRRV